MEIGTQKFSWSRTHDPGDKKAVLSWQAYEIATFQSDDVFHLQIGKRQAYGLGKGIREFVGDKVLSYQIIVLIKLSVYQWKDGTGFKMELRFDSYFESLWQCFLVCSNSKVKNSIVCFVQIGERLLWESNYIIAYCMPRLLDESERIINLSARTKMNKRDFHFHISYQISNEKNRQIYLKKAIWIPHPDVTSPCQIRKSTTFHYSNSEIS